MERATSPSDGPGHSQEASSSGQQDVREEVSINLPGGGIRRSVSRWQRMASLAHLLISENPYRRSTRKRNCRDSTAGPSAHDLRHGCVQRPRYTAALQRSQHSSYTGIADRTATQLLLASVRLFDWCTPKSRRVQPLFVAALLLVLTTAWAFMAGAYPLYLAGTEDPQEDNSIINQSSSPGSLSDWVHFPATSSWAALSDQYVLQWGALSVTAVRAGQPYRWFTSLLLHKSLMQLLASSAVLLLVSFALENRYSTVSLALFSTVSGVCANFFAALVSSRNTTICGPIAILSCHLELLILESILGWKAKGQRKLIMGRVLAAAISGLFCAAVAVLQGEEALGERVAGGLLIGLPFAMFLQKTLWRELLEIWMAPICFVMLLLACVVQPLCFYLTICT